MHNYTIMHSIYIDFRINIQTRSKNMHKNEKNVDIYPKSGIIQSAYCIKCISSAMLFISR